MTLSADVRERRRQLIIEIGEELYGERWQRQMSRALGVQQSFLSLIVSAGRPMSDNVEFALWQLCLREAVKMAEREQKLLAWVDEINRTPE